MSNKVALQEIKFALNHLWSVILVCILMASVPSAYATTGSLVATATAVQSTTATNLTAQGTSDWAHWGQSSATDFDQLSGNSQISNITVVGSGSPGQFTDSIQYMSWTNGTPTTSATNSEDGIWIAGVGNGFSFTVPASTTPQTLTVYVGGYESAGTLTASLSDGSAATYTNSSMSGTATGPDGEHYYGTFTFTYNSASAGQTLTISWVENANQDSSGSGNVTLQAATLATPTPTFSVGGGTYAAPQTVTISDANSAATIYYTTNGATPTTSSTKYTAALSVSSSETVDAIAVAGSSQSGVTSAMYIIGTAGSIVGSATAVQSATTINLTSQGTSDWAHWGQSSATDFDQLSGNSQISNITVVGSGSAAQFTDSIQEMSWTNGSPTVSATNSENGIWIAGVNNGFSFTVPASTTSQTLKVYVGGWESGGTLTAALSDGSASTYTNNSMSGSATGPDGQHYYATFTFTYNSASAGQTLKISWVENTNQDSSGSGNVTLQAATLVGVQTAATPTFSPAAGTYTGAQTVTISDSTSGSTIYYTTNGTTPTTSSTKYTAAISVSSSETIEAIADASGYSNSAVATAAYTISTPTVATPTFSPAAGTYTGTQTVTISDSTSGSTIYYTTNGTTPTTSSTKYTAAISVSSSETIEAIAAASGYSNSAVATAAYTISAPTVATPTFGPAAGTYTGTQTVTISDSTSASTIYYTTNGTTPTTSSTKYTAAISVSSSETIEAIATASGYSNSAVATAVYTISTAAAPTAPTNFTASATNYMGTASYCTVTMSWEASTSTTGISHYSVLRNGAAIATTSNLNYQDASAAANTTYSYEVEAYNPAGSASAPSTPASVGTGSCTTGQAFNLGVMYTSTQSTFSLWSPSSSNVELYLNGTLYPMTLMANQPNGYSDVYSVTVTGNLSGETYNFQVNGATTMDPYGVMSDPGTQYDIVMNPSLTTLPAGWTPRPTLANRVNSLVYETHVREFTNDPSSGIPAADKGYFEGMTDTGTTVNGVTGAPKTGVAHLVDMGVTHIQIMPFFEYNDCINTSEENTCFNWGYDPLNYNVPTANYSETPTNYTNRVLEIKQMIDNFHKQGIRVIMDVVYNHTTNESVFGNISSDYYLSTDITGTGNTINGANPMVARMIQDSLEYWVTQYNVDGFRFDLLGVFPLSTVNQWGTYLTTLYPDRNLLLFGEPWVDGTPATTALNLGDIGTIPSSHFGAFNGAYRGAIKGTDDDGGGNTGFMFDQTTSDSFFGAYVSGQTWPGTGDAGYGPISLGVAASPVPSLPATANSNVWDPAFSAAPEQSINYISVHDNLCLYDKITAWQSSNGQTGQSTTDNLIAYGSGIVLTSQGIPFMYEGDEFQHSKNGNDNSDTTEYDLVWSNLENNTYDAATYAYVKGLIALRKAHPSLQFTTWNEINSNVQSNQESASLVVTTINAAAAAGETWTQAVIVYNSNPSGQIITLPSGTWYVAVYGQTIEPAGATASSVAGSNTTPTAAPWGMTIFYQQ